MKLLDLAGLADPLLGTPLHGRVMKATPESRRATRVLLRPGVTWRPHTPGQFVTVGVDIDGVRHRRCYSITSPPSRRRVEIAVRRTPGGLVSNHVADHLRPGDLVALEQPAGDLRLPPAGSKLLFVTAGSGITPAVGMLRATAGRHHDAVLLHHDRTAADVMFAAELHGLGARADVALTSERGRIDGEQLAARCPDWMHRHAIVCGPAALVEWAAEHWADHGLAHRLQVERFQPPALPAGAATGSRTVRFAASGTTATTDGTASLLDVAEAAGLQPRSGCRMGICHTCTTPLRSGEVRDLRDGRTRAGGHVQLCVNAAAGDVEVDL